MFDWQCVTNEHDEHKTVRQNAAMNLSTAFMRYSKVEV